MSDASDHLHIVDYSFSTAASFPTPWLVRKFTLVEELSGDFQAVVELESDFRLADPTSMLGKDATLTLERKDGHKRTFSGVVQRIDLLTKTYESEHTLTQVTIEPAFSCLREEFGTRNFIKKTVPEILDEVLKPLVDDFLRETEQTLDKPRFEVGKEGSRPVYGARELCVQYGETTYQFARRIMAEEGIAYFFDFSDKFEKLVMVDENYLYPALDVDPVDVRLSEGTTAKVQLLTEFQLRHERVPAAVELRAFDFTRHLALSGKKTSNEKKNPKVAATPEDFGAAKVYDPRPEIALFDYKEEKFAFDKCDIEDKARLRLERERRHATRGSGSGNVVEFTAGHTFELAGDPVLSRSFAGKYLLTRVVHQGEAQGMRSRERKKSTAPNYTNTFECIPVNVPNALPPAVPFRPPLLPKPFAFEDYATIVSPDDKDPIHTDFHGRVRVRFMYERDEERPAQECSPFIPLAQGWAGDGFGLQIIPRAGMIVRVRYLHGDPDLPYVAGCVPTSTNFVPSALPDTKECLTLRTRSQREDGKDTIHFNEITLDDTKEKERFFQHAGWDMSTKVLNDQSNSVDGSQSVSVGGGRSVSVGATESISVTGNETQTYKANREMKVTGTNLDEISGKHTGTYKAAREETVTGGDKLTVASGGKTIDVTGKFGNTTDTEFKVTKAGTSMTITDDVDVNATGKYAIHNPGTSVKGEGTELALSGNSKVTITCGAASISLSSDGTIDITGSTVKIGNASCNAAFEAAGTTINGIKITSSAVGIHEITGALIKVG